ncbi:MAG: hypothetical protein KatS3mg061_0465 [Dehalococcoidia bacterium]|nr:MAG: hypothetical protein KatS3mg061_0465 [Dehalococcoidia bacterium]
MSGDDGSELLAEVEGGLAELDDHRGGSGCCKAGAVGDEDAAGEGPALAGGSQEVERDRLVSARYQGSSRTARAPADEGQQGRSRYCHGEIDKSGMG